LAERGIAVLRYEKRTRQHGAKLAAANRNFTVREETTEDAVLAVTPLRSRKEFDPKRIFVLGHSLGGTLAPRIAVEDGALAGIIILAGATRPLQEVAREQLVYLSSITPGAPNPEEGLQALLKRAPDSYWKDLDAYQPARVAATLRIPMLILQGERDYQVTQADLEGWRSALRGRSEGRSRTRPSIISSWWEKAKRSLPNTGNPARSRSSCWTTSLIGLVSRSAWWGDVDAERDRHRRSGFVPNSRSEK
jgi:hypothetical protein